MIIKQIRIGHFGKFASKELVFGDKLNIIRGDNESGKSTIFAFIRAMFFGIEIKRGAAGKDDVYSRYLPWDAPGAFSGSLDFEYQGKCYRIARCFLKNSQQCSCTEIDTGRKIELPSGRITDIIPELNESNYANTIEVGQQSIPVGKSLADGVGNYAANLAMTKTGEVDIPGALESLRKRTRQLKESRKEADVMSLKVEMEELETIISRQEEELAELEKSVKEYGIRIKHDEELAEELNNRLLQQKKLYEEAHPADTSCFRDEREKLNRETDGQLDIISSRFSEKSRQLKHELESERNIIEKERQQRLFDAKTVYEEANRLFSGKQEYFENKLEKLSAERSEVLQRQKENNEEAVDNALKKEENNKKTEEIHKQGKEYKKMLLSGLMMIFIGMASAYLFSGKSRVGIGVGLALAVFGVVFFLINYIKDKENSMTAEKLREEINGLDEEEKHLREENYDIDKKMERISREKERLQEQEVLERYSKLEADGKYETECRNAENRAAERGNDIEIKFGNLLNEEKVRAERERGKLEAERQQKLGDIQTRESKACGEAENYIQECRLKLEKTENELEYCKNECGILKQTDEKNRQQRDFIESERDRNEEKLSELEEKIKSCERINQETETELKAVELAYDTISNMSSLIYESFGKKLNKMLSELAAKLTDGRYTDVKVQQDMSLSFMSDIDYRGVQGLSAGTLDQLYMALRMAVGRLFFENEDVPVILDEPFAFYDGKRLKAAMEELIKSDRQILLFTCRDAEERSIEGHSTAHLELCS